MALPDIFTTTVSEGIIDRINTLTPETRAQWGKMNVAQMLAHCCVSYEYVYEPEKYKKPAGLMKLMLKLMVKPMVVNEAPYKHNGRTAPDFVIADTRDFAREQRRLIDYIRRAQKDGAPVFEGKESHSFGKLNVTEWNNMFYKHLDHHLRQFGA